MTDEKTARYEQVIRKAMTRLLPIIGITYFMAYVDRSNVALAKTALAADAGIGAAAYGPKFVDATNVTAGARVVRRPGRGDMRRPPPGPGRADRAW
jgi:hypothetical protein